METAYRSGSVSKNNFLESFTISQIAMALTVGLGMKKDNVSVDELIEQCRSALPKEEPRKGVKVKQRQQSRQNCPSCGSTSWRRRTPKGLTKRDTIMWCYSCTYSEPVGGK